MTHNATPPRWAEAVLRLMLRPGDRESVSGDLLEEYRESVRPRRGRWRADAWYLTQVVGFAWRSTGVWGVLFAAAFIGRTALDWLVPTDDFETRGTVTTLLAIAIYAGAGLWAAWRVGSVRAGALAGVLTGAIASAFSAAGALALLAIWHDPQTMAAIQGSGGLGEVFVLPTMMVVPGTICATAGALVGRSLVSFRRSDVAE